MVLRAKENELEWIKKNNSILAFCESHIQTDYESYITKEEFRREYSIYCKSHNVKPMGDQSIKIHLENELFAENSVVRATTLKQCKEYSQTEFESDLIRVWKGVSFINKPSSVTTVTTVTPLSTSAKEVKNSPLEVKPPVTPATPVTKPLNDDNFFINNSSNDEVVEEEVKPEGVLQAILDTFSFGVAQHKETIITRLKDYSDVLVEDGISKLKKTGEINGDR